MSLPSPTAKRDCLSLILLIVIWPWVALIPFVRILAEYVYSSLMLGALGWINAGFDLAQAFLLALPLVPLALWWKNRPYQSIYRSWAAALIFALAMIPVHFVRQTDAQAQALLRIIFGMLAILLVFTLGRLARRKVGREVNPQLRSLLGGEIFFVIILAGLFYIPWVAWGALGSFLDTVLQFLAALVFGLAAAITLEIFLFHPLRETTIPSWSSYLLGGIGAGAALELLSCSTAFPYGGMQILLLAALPPLGWIMTGLALPGSQKQFLWLAPALLIGLAAAAPMMLVDADELFLLINASGSEIFNWSFKAAQVCAALGWTVGAIGFFWTLGRALKSSQSSEPARPRSFLGWALALICLLVWITTTIIYFTAGQPGLHGEGLFVILKDQADVSQAVHITDYQERRQFVYTTLVEHANTTQADLRAMLERLHIAYTPYYLVNAIQVEGDPLLRLWLLLRPEVDRVLDNPWLRPLPQSPPTSLGEIVSPPSETWNLKLIHADRVWRELGVTGEGILIGQSDSGVQGDHPELAARYRGAASGENDYNWLDPWNATTSPTDVGGHGTHTLGIILGEHTGVAPGATWIGCVNLARNLGNPALYLNCMQFMFAPYPQGADPLQAGDPSRGAHVLNNSWGCPDIEGCDPQALLPAVRALRSAGVFFVAGAGNEGPRCETIKDPPSLYAEVFSVGAIDSGSQLAEFSSLGPVTADQSNRVKPDIVAPGVAIISSMPGSAYGSRNGTSMAGPHVAGVVALMWSVNPTLIGDIERTERILRETAQPYTGALPACPGAQDQPSTAVGYGIVDAYAAVKAAMEEKDK